MKRCSREDWGLLFLYSAIAGQLSNDARRRGAVYASSRQSNSHFGLFTLRRKSPG